MTVNLGLAGPQQVNTLTNDTLYSMQNVTGSAYDDVLTAAAGGSTLVGGAGNDTLNGGAGNDTLQGGLGDDVMNGGTGTNILSGGSGINTASYSGQTLGVTVNLGLAGPQQVNATTNDTMYSIQNVIGSAQDDVLTNAAGIHALTGGAGNDTFAFTAPVGIGNVTTLTDFTSGQDVIALSTNIFAGLGTIGSTVGLSDHLLYDAVSGALSFDADGSGSGAPVTFAVLGTNTHPAAIGNDFKLVS